MNEYAEADQPITEDELDAVPSAITQRSRWVWWRRALEMPPVADRERVTAWITLKRELAALDRTCIPAALVVRGEGIFSESIRRVDFLCGFGETALTLDGLVRGTEGLRSTHLVCPAGRIANERRITEFSFNITDVDGITNSKSSDRYFPSVRHFGLDFTTYKKETVDTAGLSRMLAHGEVRIIRDKPSDRVGVRLWDGRLFLYNAGGSHHFAGAAYIAGEIQEAVRLKSRLEVIELNESAIQWMLGKFIPLAVPIGAARKLRRLTAQILGSSYTLPVPGVLARETEFLFLPADVDTSDVVSELFYQTGMVSLNPWFESLLTAQRENRVALVRRFPTMFACADPT